MGLRQLWPVTVAGVLSGSELCLGQEATGPDSSAPVVRLHWGPQARE